MGGDGYGDTDVGGVGVGVDLGDIVTLESDSVRVSIGGGTTVDVPGWGDGGGEGCDASC